MTPQTFRCSWTTELIRRGANLYHVKELLEYQSLETLKPYTKLTIKDLKATHAQNEGSIIITCNRDHFLG